MKKVVCISGTNTTRNAAAAEALRDALVEKGQRVLITRFTDPLEDLCKRWFDWDGKKDQSGRSLLNCIGDDIIRGEDPDFWVRFTFRLLGMICDEWDYAIIPDCRFANEVVLDWGWPAVHIQAGPNAVSGLEHIPVSAIWKGADWDVNGLARAILNEDTDKNLS